MGRERKQVSVRRDTKEKRRRFRLAKHRGYRLRVVFHRSHRYLYAQLVDDSVGRTLCAASDRASRGAGKTRTERASEIGRVLGASIAAKLPGVGCVLDHKWYKYHGVVAAFCDSLRSVGINI